ncbi:uncharacterized protein LOC130447080 [Diorhabda sublineata]|uniref:uncharacterized protein LOC130447080 n=1 Tax=Diorhabda sublineata TaxID=1163346 RepID=UPI0024E11446|nr:uncharacterized protein LOC130447080 [Diorhabda sublineata]
MSNWWYANSLLLNLKSTLSMKQKVDISKYPKLQASLKRKSEGYEPKKARTLSSNDIKQFIGKASDIKYLRSKQMMRGRSLLLIEKAMKAIAEEPGSSVQHRNVEQDAELRGIFFK